MRFIFARSKKNLVIRKNERELESHEVLFGAGTYRKEAIGKGETWEERLELPIQAMMFRALLGLAGIVLLVLFLRLLYLQVLKGEHYATLAKINTEYVRPVHAPRGIIYDRNGEPLVANKKTYDVFFDSRIRVSTPEEEELETLSDILGIAKGELAKSIAARKEATLLIASYVIQEHALRIASLFGPASGIRVEPNYTREYRSPYSFSHVVGYTGYATKEYLSVSKELSPTDLVGKSGLEFSYDSYIRGENGGIITKVNSKNEPLGEAHLKDPTPGDDLYLSIDGMLQEKIYEVFRERGVIRGAAVALDPKTGDVLAIVSVPGFDSTALSRGIDAAALRDLTNDPSEPFFTRAISGQYPPGSTLKPFIALAALEDGVISPQKKIYAPAAIFVPNIYNPEVVYRFPDWKEHGWVNMVKAIAVSSNVYFYHVGGGFGEIKGLGIERIVSYLKRFGLGRILEIDIAGEASGFLPTPEWKRDAKGEDWYIGDTYNVSIGQGDVSLTPLQLASATSGIANGGTLFSPRIVQRVVKYEGGVIRENQSKTTSSYGISGDNVRVVQEGMREAVRSGSSRLLADVSVAVAGKTGTAQAGKQKQPHAWWTGFAPYEDPRIALTVLVENGGEGSAVAVPIAKEVLGWYFENRK